MHAYIFFRSNGSPVFVLALETKMVAVLLVSIYPDFIVLQFKYSLVIAGITCELLFNALDAFSSTLSWNRN